MATIDYKEKYEKAVQAAMLAKQDTESAVTVQTLEEIFPEIRESEDERIRKWLIEYFKKINNEIAYKDRESIIAWLEKQGEQKQEVEGNPNARKPTLRIIKGKSYLCIKDYRDKNCTFTKGKIYESDKDGFLVDDEEKDTFERKKWEKDAIEYFSLFEQNKTKDVVTDEKQKPAWSEEDEIRLKHILRLLDVKDDKKYLLMFGLNSLQDLEKDIAWLKSLKERVQPHSEWGEEDGDIRDNIIRDLKNTRLLATLRIQQAVGLTQRII